MACLVGLDGKLKDQRFTLKSPCLIGRGPYNHVVLDDVRVSRQHTKVSPEKGGHVIYDLNSVNGTHVNDVLVRRKKLEPDDVVRIGPFTFRFEDGEDREITHRIARPEFMEVLTLTGFEPPAQIIGSLDAAEATSGVRAVGLNDLEDAYRKLRTLYQFTRSISATLDPTELVERILRNLLDTFPAAQTVALYARDPSGAMVPRMTLPQQKGEPSGLLKLPTQFQSEVVARGRAILSAPAKGGMSMHSPMLLGDAVQGVLHVRSAEGRDARFSQGDLDLLTGVAAQAAMALANAKMHQESIRQQRLQQDLLFAEQIQKSFLPREIPEVEGVEFVTEYRPAYSVGGDFYDVFWCDGARERLGVFIGDVSGKGVSAALLMARISSDLRVAALAEPDPAAALQRVNQIVLERKQPEFFVTGILLTLDVRTHEVVLANAGHPPPLVRRKAEGLIERIDQGGGAAIGFCEVAGCELQRFRLDPGDTLVLCTDGVVEASDGHSQQFGAERLERSLGHGSSRADELAARLLKDVRRHVGEAAQNDDLTLIVCGIADGVKARKPKIGGATVTMMPRGAAVHASGAGKGGPRAE